MPDSKEKKKKEQSDKSKSQSNEQSNEDNLKHSYTDEEIEDLDLESQKVKNLMKQYKKKKGKYTLPWMKLIP